jgi:hypothetical protein
MIAGPILGIWWTRRGMSGSVVSSPHIWRRIQTVGSCGLLALSVLWEGQRMCRGHRRRLPLA